MLMLLNLRKLNETPGTIAEEIEVDFGKMRRMSPVVRFEESEERDSGTRIYFDAEDFIDVKDTRSQIRFAIHQAMRGTQPAASPLRSM